MISITKELPRAIEEIKKIKKRLDDLERGSTKEELIYNQDESIEYIKQAMNADYAGLIQVPSADYVRLILDYDEEYMRSKGIIED